MSLTPWKTYSNHWKMIALNKKLQIRMKFGCGKGGLRVSKSGTHRHASSQNFPHPGQNSGI